MKGCVEMRICVAPGLEENIIRFQKWEAFKTGKHPYRKNEAAADFFEKLNKFADQVLPEKEKG